MAVVGWLIPGLVLGFLPVPVQSHETTAGRISRHLRHVHHAIQWRGHVTVESLTDLAGGAGRGTTGAMAAVGGLALDTRRLGGWTGGTFTAEVMGLERLPGRESRLVGDAQGVSNLYNSFSFFRLIMLSYRQRIARQTLLRGGILDVNSYFDTTGTALDLLNSSFGMTPTVTVNVPLTPTAPYTGWGVVFRQGPMENRWRAGIFAGDPAARGTLTQGAFLIGEWQRDPVPGERFKIGAWLYHNPEGPSQGNLASPPTTDGIYGVWEDRSPERGSEPGWFVQAGLNPGAANYIPFYLGAGVRLRSLPGQNPLTAVTAGVARAWIRGHVPESAWEVAYDEDWTSEIMVEPDLQYVMHPGGIYPDAWVFLLRLRGDF